MLYGGGGGGGGGGSREQYDSLQSRMDELSMNSCQVYEAGIQKYVNFVCVWVHAVD